MEMKTLDGWHEYAKAHGKSGWSEYCHPGDQISEDVYDYFLDLLPPRTMRGGYFQVGEPSDSRRNPRTGRFANTYPTFLQKNGTYFYMGDCFAGEQENTALWINHRSLQNYLAATVRLGEDGLQRSRPHILCADGFTLSVQAGAQFYSIPRVDLSDGAYENVEVGCLSKKEELLSAYAEGKKITDKTVYPRVPVTLVEDVIQKHGGFYESRIPVVAA